MMRPTSTLLLAALAAPLAVIADPASYEDTVVSRQTAAVVKPTPCQPFNATLDETVARFDDFACNFIYTQNITGAFEYISEGYINHNPLAENGFDSAWNILSPIWADQNITVWGTSFEPSPVPQGYLQYTSDFGTIVDRFRWENGCIAEHWDQNETFPG
ncbi:hypothetical protein LSUE1_G000290 [Lachnellula suecica]|uniref:SnoaL-like domain-containing protein n=1 Tax=Lachnellula suecica TaxID=602035 RepID=A0A8T9CIA3_9HELO|nr:hypothetical protein LSUE1_G000290 [Lachnellula suecica]